jgi:hypothetical protein
VAPIAQYGGIFNGVPEGYIYGIGQSLYMTTGLDFVADTTGLVPGVDYGLVMTWAGSCASNPPASGPPLPGNRAASRHEPRRGEARLLPLSAPPRVGAGTTARPHPPDVGRSNRSSTRGGSDGQRAGRTSSLCWTASRGGSSSPQTRTTTRSAACTTRWSTGGRP